jgi:hypothetical protein
LQKFKIQRIGKFATRIFKIHKRNYIMYVYDDTVNKLRRAYVEDTDDVKRNVFVALDHVLGRDLAGMTMDFIFRNHTPRLDIDVVFDVWFQRHGTWLESRLIRDGVYPDFTGHQKEHDYLDVLTQGRPAFVRSFRSPSQNNIDDVMVNYHLPDSHHIRAYGSCILVPHHTRYSIEQLTLASQSGTLMVCDTLDVYYFATIITANDHDAVYVKYTGYESQWNEWLPLHSHRFHILSQDQSRLAAAHRSESSNFFHMTFWRKEMVNHLTCYHRYQHLTIDLLMECNFNDERIVQQLSSVCVYNKCRKYVP